MTGAPMGASAGAPNGTAGPAGDLVRANRILAREGVLDADGHVSARLAGAGGGFLLSRSRAAELVEAGDLVAHGPDGEAVGGCEWPLFLERHLHAAIYARRAEVGAICHAHTPSILSFGVAETPLRAVIHSARFLGTAVPVWDLAREFPGEASPLVGNPVYAASLAERLDGSAVVLLRGHGCVVVGRDPQEVVARCLAMDRNARVQLVAQRLGEYVSLHEGECEDLSTPAPPLSADNRAWEYLCRRAGVE